MLIDGDGGASVRLKVCRAHVVVGIGAEVQYHDGGVGESIHVADWVGARLEFFLAVNGRCFFLSKGQCLGHREVLHVPDFVVGSAVCNVPYDVVLKRCTAIEVLPIRVR